MARTRTTKRKGPRTMTLLRGRKPMPAGKRIPSAVTPTKSKNKGNFKVKTLLENPKEVTAKNRRTGEERKMTVRRIANYLTAKRKRRE